MTFDNVRYSRVPKFGWITKKASCIGDIWEALSDKCSMVGGILL